MKVVLFCGGLGMRLRDRADNVPKPMVPIGDHPILWHLMRYYAHHGHSDFILCLGHRGEVIRRYFADSGPGLERQFRHWRVTFAETAPGANIGQRLWAVRDLVAGEERFLANYADGLTNLPLPAQIAHARASGRVASFLSVKPNLSYHHVQTAADGLVTAFEDIRESGVRVNGGFFVLRPEIFDYMEPGEDLVMEPFQRLIAARQLVAYRYDGFWLAVDTAKDKARADDYFASGNPPWQVWDHPTPVASG